MHLLHLSALRRRRGLRHKTTFHPVVSNIAALRLYNNRWWSTNDLDLRLEKLWLEGFSRRAKYLGAVRGKSVKSGLERTSFC